MVMVKKKAKQKPKGKGKNKSKSKKNSIITRLDCCLRDYKKHKFVLFLVLLLFIPVVMFFNNRYQDWNNARQLKSIVADMEGLRTSLENETGVPMELNKSCFTTQEKYSSGKTACYLELYSENTSGDKRTDITKIIDGLDAFKEISNTNSNSLYDSTFGRCVASFNPESFDIFSFECPVAVREANDSLRKELFTQ